ncbi:hypothetical protein SAMN05444392_102281 [Seinonella peptonophila]|uniref:Phage minor structural protein GP20 n=1 Tax=Seinonella peptonophila TaxID=112248 RepID=A0A1M4VBQ8_9BACL|nr:hypothetical protein [Seinonella peptonophila]SHE66381.1 hypothetical protein SAMN05444392_102281 [Seinonella peptonophila]
MSDENKLELQNNSNPAEDVKDTGTEIKTFTEDEVNERINKAVTDRLNRMKKKYEGFDEIKSELEELRSFKSQAEEKNMTELEKLQKQIELLSNERDELKTNYSSLQEERQKEKLHNSFREQARKAGIEYVEDALQLASNQLSSLEPNEEGNYIELEDLVKELTESKPFLVSAKKEAPKPIGNASNPNTNQVEKTNEQLLKEAEDKFKKSQTTEDLAALMRVRGQLGL